MESEITVISHLKSTLYKILNLSKVTRTQSLDGHLEVQTRRRHRHHRPGIVKTEL